MMNQPGFFFCICPDSSLLRDYVDKEFLPLLGTETVVSVFWSDEGLERRFWDALTLLEMGSGLRILLIRNAQQIPADTWKKLSSALAVPRPGVVPVFCLECVWEKGQPKLPAFIAKQKCFAFAEKKGWMWRSPGLDIRSLRPYIQRQAVEKNLHMTSDALNTLAEMTIPDASAVSGLLEQLSLASAEGNVDAALVRQMAEFTPDALIFDVIRQLENGNTVQVWKTLLREGDGGESLLFPLITLMARELRILWQMAAGENVYCPRYVEAEKRRIADRLGFDGLSRLFADLARAEFSVKSGSRQPLQALEELTAQLSLAFGHGNAHGGAA